MIGTFVAKWPFGYSCGKGESQAEGPQREDASYVIVLR